jgi:GNAT superfamily N-acetyltransferase
MSDMLVRLYTQVECMALVKNLEKSGIDIRRALTAEKHIVVEWVLTHFTAHSASECEAAFYHSPVSCFIAVLEGEVDGFCCYDVTCKGFIGPIGVREDMRGKGIGKALLLTSLNDMAHQGYAYAIIGDAGPEKFFSATAGATIIHGSEPGMYQGMLRKNI